MCFCDSCIFFPFLGAYEKEGSNFRETLVCSQKKSEARFPGSCPLRLAFSAGFQLIVTILNNSFALYVGAFCGSEVESFSSCLFLSCCSRKLAGPKCRKRIGWMEFRLFHYAGEVTYCTKGECLWGTGYRSQPCRCPRVHWKTAAHLSQMFPSPAWKYAILKVF